MRNLLTACRDDTACYAAQARSDFDNGKMILFYIGLLEGGSFTEHYINCIEGSTNIYIIGAGCVGHDGLVEYNSIMSSLIIEKFGTGYLDSCRTLAEKEAGPICRLRHSIW